MKISTILATPAAALLVAATAHAGTFTAAPFTGNVDSGVNSALTYTHAIDLNGTGEVINGVTFVAGGSGLQAALNYDLENVANSFANNGNNLTGTINGLASNFFYNPNGKTAPTETLTLTGLTPGTTYTASFYGVGFGSVGGRYNDVSDGLGGTILYDENSQGGGNGSLLTDTYTPTGNSVTFSFTIDTANSNPGDTNSTTLNDSYHQYGFSNATAVPEPSTWVAAGGLVLLAAGDFRRRLKA